MKKYTNLYLGLFALVAVVFGCRSVRVSTDYDQSVNFSEYETFQFVAVEQDLLDGVNLTQEQIDFIKNQIYQALTAKGLNQAPNADLAINIGVRVEEKTQKREQDIRQDFRYMGQRRYSWSASDSITIGTYREGSLAVDMVDRQMNTMIWQGIAKDVLGKLPQFEDKVQVAVEELFANFPPDGASR
jgi:hypothetical protein